VNQYRDDFKLMVRNAKTYNQEGSWVYIDAEEMERVFDATFERVTAGSGLPGASAASASAAAAAPYSAALTPMEEDERPAPSSSRRVNTRWVPSDDEYLTPSDDE
jgi:ATP-dependent helicase STH1/SNF2